MLDKLLEEYIDKFGEGFPTFQVFRGITEEERIAVVQECIDKGKNAYELGLCSLDDDLYY